jgi:hypothetical protein
MKQPLQSSHLVIPLIFKSAFFTLLNAIKTIDASRRIHGHVFEVDTGCFAGTGAPAAEGAVFGVEPDLVKGMFADEPQQGAYRTNRIAVNPAVSPGHDADDNQGDQRDEGRTQAEQVNSYFVESEVAGWYQQ